MRKNNEKGHSMVEMLGVLAIIGVLSASGLAGFMLDNIANFKKENRRRDYLKF